MCATRGALVAVDDRGVRSSDAVLRLVVPSAGGDAARMRFVITGPSAGVARAGSGATYHQVGLKLRAQNGCNLLYVMWRFLPEPRLVVAIKHNPGAADHAACGNRGYRFLRANRALPPPAILPGETHELAARISDEALTVHADGREIWRGDLPPEAASLRGPMGLRSDNVSLSFYLFADTDTDTAAHPICPKSANDD
jgi:hypothetical protein